MHEVCNLKLGIVARGGIQDVKLLFFAQKYCLGVSLCAIFLESCLPIFTGLKFHMYES